MLFGVAFIASPIQPSTPAAQQADIESSPVSDTSRINTAQ